MDVTGARVVIKNASGRTRGLEGLDDVSQVLRGDMPSAPIQVPMNGAIYMADLAGGRKQDYSLINVPITPLRRAYQKARVFWMSFPMWVGFHWRHLRQVRIMPWRLMARCGA